MKTITLKYFDEAEQTVHEYQYQYPTDKELLEIFPEARDIIPIKIQGWTRVNGKLICKETIPYLRLCNTLKNPFAQAFWKDAYLVMAGRFNECQRQLGRLRRLEAMLNKPESFEAWAVQKHRAKERPIIELYDFQKLRKSGNGHVCLCPLHPDKNPSFHIWTDGNTWFCYGCNHGGDSIELVMLLHKIEFRAAVDYLVGGAQ